MSYSAPSGLTRKTIQISRVLTMLVIRGVGSVAVDEPVEDVQRHLDAHVLVGVGATVEQDLGLRFVHVHMVRDLGGPQLAALVALADRKDRHDVWMSRRHGRDVCGDLGVAVIALFAGRELGRRGDRRGHQRDERAEDDSKGGASRTGLTHRTDGAPSVEGLSRVVGASGVAADVPVRFWPWRTSSRSFAWWMGGARRMRPPRSSAPKASVLSTAIPGTYSAGHR